MTSLDIWVVTFENSYPIEENGQSVVIDGDISRVSFDNRDEAVSFARKILKTTPVWKLTIQPMMYEEFESDKE